MVDDADVEIASPGIFLAVWLEARSVPGRVVHEESYHGLGWMLDALGDFEKRGLSA